MCTILHVMLRKMRRTDITVLLRTLVVDFFSNLLLIMHAGTRIAKLLPKYENLNVGAVGINFCYKIELLHCICMPRVKSSEAYGIFSFRPCLTAYCPTQHEQIRNKFQHDTH